MQREGLSGAADIAPVGAGDGHHDGRPGASKGDASVEIADYVRRNSKTVDVRTLNDRGLKHIQLMTTSMLRELVSREVARSVERSRERMDEIRSDEIESEVQAELRKRLEEYRQEREAAGQLTPRNVLLSSMAGSSPADRPAPESGEQGAISISPDALGRYEEKLRRIDEESRIYSREAFAELELRLQFIVLETLDKELCRKGYRGTVDLEGFRQGLEQVVTDVLQAELERRLLRLGDDASERADLLDRRLEKLKGELLEMEIAMDAMAQRGDPGLASIYDEVQSLNRQDPAYEKKKGMLRNIFESNLELQGRAK